MSLTFKLLLAAIVAFIVIAIWPSRTSDTRMMAQARQVFHQACVAKGTEQKVLPADRLETFCSCSAEKAVSDLGTDGVKRVNAATSLTPADRELIDSVQKVCLEMAGGR